MQHLSYSEYQWWFLLWQLALVQRTGSNHDPHHRYCVLSLCQQHIPSSTKNGYIHICADEIFAMLKLLLSKRYLQQYSPLPTVQIGEVWRDVNKVQSNLWDDYPLANLHKVAIHLSTEVHTGYEYDQSDLWFYAKYTSWDKCIYHNVLVFYHNKYHVAICLKWFKNYFHNGIS